MPRVEFTKNPETASAIRRWWDQRFSTPPDIRFTVPNGDACISMIRHGLGYGLFPDPRYIQDEPELYALPLCFLDGSPLSREMWMLFDQEHPLTAVTSNFIRFVRESLLL